MQSKYIFNFDEKVPSKDIAVDLRFFMNTAQASKEMIDKWAN